MIVPSTPGSAPDAYARILGESLGTQFSQTMVVENRPAGGGGLIAATAVTRAAADGYTLLVATAGLMTINPSAYKKLPYAPDDFSYVCKGVEFPLILVVHPSVGVTDIAALGKWLKQHPDQASYASYQPGTPSHFLGYQLSEKLGVKMTHIPYRGGTPQVTDLIGGSVKIGFATLTSVLPQIKAGKLLALATTGPRRLESLKDVATIAEQGYPDLTTTAWFGLLAPKGTPTNVIAQLTKAHQQAMADPAMRAKFEAQGLDVAQVCGGDFVKLIEQETERWAKVVKATGFTAEN